MIQCLVVPLDGSSVAEEALPTATAIAGVTGAAIHLVLVRGMTPAATDEPEVDSARNYVTAVRERLAASGRDVSVALLPEEPPQLLMPAPSPRTTARRIAEYASQQQAQLVVMTTHGRSGLSRRWFGSVTDAMLRASTVPLLLIRPGEAEPSGASAKPRSVAHVLLALAPDDEPAALIDVTQSAVGRFDPRYTLLRILPQPFAISSGNYVPAALISPSTDTAAAREAAERDLRAQAHALPVQKVAVATRFDANPAQAILDFATQNDVDLIVVGTHSRRGIDRLLLGSVADKVVRGADCLLLVVPRYI